MNEECTTEELFDRAKAQRDAALEQWKSTKGATKGARWAVYTAYAELADAYAAILRAETTASTKLCRACGRVGTP